MKQWFLVCAFDKWLRITKVKCALVVEAISSLLLDVLAAFRQKVEQEMKGLRDAGGGSWCNSKIATKKKKEGLELSIQ